MYGDFVFSKKTGPYIEEGLSNYYQIIHVAKSSKYSKQFQSKDINKLERKVREFIAEKERAQAYRDLQYEFDYLFINRQIKLKWLGVDLSNIWLAGFYKIESEQMCALIRMECTVDGEHTLSVGDEVCFFEVKEIVENPFYDAYEQNCGQNEYQEETTKYVIKKQSIRHHIEMLESTIDVVKKYL